MGLAISFFSGSSNAEFFLTENSEGDPRCCNFIKRKDIYIGGKPDIYKPAREAELLSKQNREEAELLVKKKRTVQLS
jgi:hypothetical protein